MGGLCLQQVKERELGFAGRCDRRPDGSGEGLLGQEGAKDLYKWLRKWHWPWSHQARVFALVLLHTRGGVAIELFPSPGLSFLICEMRGSDCRQKQQAGRQLTKRGSATGPFRRGPGSAVTLGRLSGEAF